jgi:PPOX class probable F420-dependent enzyme
VDGLVSGRVVVVARMSAMPLTETQRAFLRDNAFSAIVTTLRADGSPHSTVVWVDEEGGDVLFNTAEGRAKPRHLAADPRLSITVVDPADQYRWLSVSGTAELSTEGAREQIDHLARKYMGEDYPWYQGEQRLIVRIKPEKVDSRGLE